MSYNQSSTVIRNDKYFVVKALFNYCSLKWFQEGSKKRNYGIGVQYFNQNVDYKEKTLLLYILDQTLNKNYPDKLDEQAIIDYLSEAKENSKRHSIYFSSYISIEKDQEVLRPIPLKHEQYVNQVLKYSSNDLREIYMDIFKISSIPRQLFYSDLEPKPDLTWFYRKMKTQKGSFMINLGCPETLWN